MKEYIASTGGRFTYVDDLLNLQELSVSMTAIFEGCSNFIISGCEVIGSAITPGYVWIAGKVRRYEGCASAQFPHYLYEKNAFESVTYANDVNKQGRCNWLCEGGVSVPQLNDPVTGRLPGFIEMKADYSPRFAEKFFGRYGVLLETPFSRQTIKKDLVLAGKFTAEKDIESKTAVSVSNPQNGYTLKNLIKPSGEASIGTYLNGLLVNEIIINTDGSFAFYKAGREIARVTENGFAVTNIHSTESKVGTLYLFDSNITNSVDNNDQGTVSVNYTGYQGGGERYRNFNVYDGRAAHTMLFQVAGKTASVSVTALLAVANDGRGITLRNTTYDKSQTALTNLITWNDKVDNNIGWVGYESGTSFDFVIRNTLGNVVMYPLGALDVKGELKINGVSVETTYVDRTSFTTELAKKVNIQSGKQLSTEDFTTFYKNKLDSITSGSITGGNDGYVGAGDVSAALAKKLSTDSNLSDVKDKGTARANLDVYSKGEVSGSFLKISGMLSELVSLSASEIEGKTAEQIVQMRSAKQTTVRDNIEAEKKGTGDLKLAKASNLSDLTDKAAARQNLSVYSRADIDGLLAGKLGSDSAYQGSIFTTDHRTKLEAIKTGSFAGKNDQGVSVSLVEGYVMTSSVVKELDKKAALMLDNYNSAQKMTIAENIDVYSKSGAEAKFASVDSILQDYISKLVSQGKTTQQAQAILRDKLNVLSREEVSDAYMRKDAKLTDMVLPNADAKKLACRTIGAAYADEYQTKLIDTGWLQMLNSGTNTNTNSLFVRQIGNIVSIQGMVNTSRADGGHWGGVVAVIPNQIQPPRYGVRNCLADWNDDHKYNRGSTFQIDSGGRQLRIYESGMGNQDTYVNFTYMT